jgi:hypothetical protein
MAAAREGGGGRDRARVSGIDAYLEALRRQLPRDPFYRRRVLAEIDDHLRASAAEHGEEEALARFGAPGEVAARLAPAAAAAAARFASIAVLACVLAFAAAAVATENLLPPAPWPSADAAPDLVRWTSTGLVWAFATTALLGLAGLARPRRFLLLAAAIAVSASCLLGFVNLVERARLYAELEAAGRIDALALVGGSIYLALVASAALGVAVWASLVAATARRASSSYGLSA